MTESINHPADMNRHIREVAADPETALHFARLGFFAAYRMTGLGEVAADMGFDDWWTEVTEER